MENLDNCCGTENCHCKTYSVLREEKFLKALENAMNSFSWNEAEALFKANNFTWENPRFYEGVPSIEHMKSLVIYLAKKAFKEIDSIQESVSKSLGRFIVEVATEYEDNPDMDSYCTVDIALIAFSSMGTSHNAVTDEVEI